MSNKCIKDRLPLGTFLGIAIFHAAFSVQRGSQSCAYNLIYLSYKQLVLEHSSYTTFTASFFFLLVLFVFGKAALFIATHGLSVYIHSHAEFPSQLYLTWKQETALLWSFQLVCHGWKKVYFFKCPHCSSNVFTLFTQFLLHPKKA